MNMLKRYLDILLALLIMLVLSAMNLSQRQDVLIQAYIEEKTLKFIENVKVHGYLSIQIYEAFMRDIQSNGHYNIEITHEKQIYEPEYVNKIFTNRVMSYSESCYTDEIIEALYEKGIYYMKKDDYFTVTIKRNSLTLGMAMFKSIMGYTYFQEATQSGRIRDVAR